MGSWLDIGNASDLHLLHCDESGVFVGMGSKPTEGQDSSFDVSMYIFNSEHVQDFVDSYIKGFARATPDCEFF